MMGRDCNGHVSIDMRARFDRKMEVHKLWLIW